MENIDYGRFLEADYFIGNYFECMFLKEYQEKESYEESAKRLNYFVNNIDEFSKSVGMNDAEKDSLLFALKNFKSFDDEFYSIVDKKMYSDGFYEWEECQDRFCDSVIKKLKDSDTMYLYKSKNGMLSENDTKENQELVSDFVKSWVGLEFKVLEYI